MQLPNHGANPHHVYAKLGIEPPDTLLDFSENVNPAGPPQAVSDSWPALLSKLSAYPDPFGEPFLSAAANFHGVSTPYLFAGNGAAELLALIAERYQGKKALIVHPTFSEYEATLTAKNVEVIQIIASETDGFDLPLATILEKMKEVSVLYLCTPNNPTGRLPTRDQLQTIVRRGAEVDCDCVFDEAFIDFVDESLSFIPEVENYPHVTVVRSMTKMYAIPGIRLGYVVASPSIIMDIKARAPHWNVNGIAAQIGAVCLREETYRQQVIHQSTVERQRLTEFLRRHGCTVTDSVANFLSFKPGPHQQASKLFQDLLQQGIVLRHSENFLGMDGHWLRVGMKKEAEMTRLKEVLAIWFAEN
ncbi:threonine-phosphate decarboxylase CobD [Filibacter tadaridae]|uniref:threonine-phosphate decarboxylase n=1 Tax=Filibacter tadaridae TaxID=2483811 RepID=A0A3P5WFM0_9BACL|nr:threonine-phosphate decarboxylase CobD [Filibacter tadaridae]VDC19381.1 Threonine-phosphate decarboxylase [Filibacter tadaridae]